MAEENKTTKNKELGVELDKDSRAILMMLDEDDNSNEKLDEAAFDYDEIYVDGYGCGFEDATSICCPYPPDSKQGAEWLRGFYEARADFELDIWY